MTSPCLGGRPAHPNDGVWGQLVRQRERWYLARTGQACREVHGVDAMHAADGIAAWRWWTLAEFDATVETVWPAGSSTSSG
jgi:hypothetical protein